MVIVLCHLFSYIVEAVILWQYTSNLFIAKQQSRNRVCVLGSLYMILFSALLFDSKWLNAVLYLLANFIFLHPTWAAQRCAQCGRRWKG